MMISKQDEMLTQLRINIIENFILSWTIKPNDTIYQKLCRLTEQIIYHDNTAELEETSMLIIDFLTSCADAIDNWADFNIESEEELYDFLEEVFLEELEYELDTIFNRSND